MSNEDKEKLISALNAISPADCNYQQWVNIGMALKAEGFDWSDWDSWSRTDSARYHSGECEAKWKTFAGDGITCATIFMMAQKSGWSQTSSRYAGADMVMDFDDVIQDDGDGMTEYNSFDNWNGAAELKRYLELLFEPNDIVGYVLDTYADKDGKKKPASKGCFDRTAGALIESLERYPDDLGATIGDWDTEAGAWIRFNPLDGEGAKNANVTKYRYALVESDTMTIGEQDQLYRKLELPIAALVHSGGKSLHAIVHIDADDAKEYRKRVTFLFDYLAKNGMVVDTQNSNPSRLSRMPGVTRAGKRQYLVDSNIGRKGWAEWMDFVEGTDDELPDIASLDEYIDNRPVPPEEIIEGVLRKGHKMLISGPSKAGKSYLLMELCVSFAEGVPWIGRFSCKQCKVLYINLEIDGRSAVNRFFNIYDALKLPYKHMKNIDIWNLRGKALPLDKLVPKLIRRIKGKDYSVVIIDPIYKVITGDENNASDMGAFCNQFDRICNEAGVAAIYCHHHSKGAQGGKRAMDRASGSGVFARDPDAQLDIIELELTDKIKNTIRDGHATAWRMESSLREFENIDPVNFWFEHPIHRVDEENLAGLYSEGSTEANLGKSSKRTSEDERFDAIDTAFDVVAQNGYCRVSDLAEYTGRDYKTIQKYLKEFDDCFSVDKGGIVSRKSLE